MTEPTTTVPHLASGDVAVNDTVPVLTSQELTERLLELEQRVSDMDSGQRVIYR